MPRIVLKDLETEKPLAVGDLEATLGRDPACAFFIEGPKSKVVSGRHARIFFQDDTWWIEDTSRNGTVLDSERLQAGQRHAIRVGQVIGLGESGPRLRVVALDSRKVAETLMELPDVDAPLAPPKPKTTAPRPAAATSNKPAPAAEVSEGTMALRRSEALRAGVRIEEPTEPMSPAPDWLVQVVLVATNTNKRYDVTSMVVKLGRSPECNVQIPPELGASVSRMHAEIAIQDGGVMVRDAGSRNGTFVNGKRLDAPQPAAKNDLIMLGSGGPTFSIEDLHIVKAPTPPSGPPGGGGRAEATPVEPKPSKGSSKPLVEPRTDPTPLAKAKGALKADVLEDMSQQGAKRVRVFVWASVIAAVALAVFLLAVTQGRVAESEQRMAQLEQFDAARRTVLEQSLLRARESLNEQLASADSARRQAEQEMARLRAELGEASGGDASRGTLDSLRRALKAAEDRATAVGTQVRAIRASNLAQVAQLNQGAVGLLVSFIGERVVSGSGFAITPSGYFVTNRHVVVDDSGKVRDTIYVTMADQRFTLANRIQVVALGSRELDIAVVKIPDYRGPHMKKVDWSAAGANQGEPAALIGFPYGVELAFDDTSSNVVRTSLSAGVFSKVAPDRIQFDAFTVGGSSGSPILNAAGEVVAVHRASLGTGPGLGVSIPISRIVSLLPVDARNELGIR